MAMAQQAHNEDFGPEFFGYPIDYTSNHMHLENMQADFNQASILNPNESELMGSFFKSPDNFATTTKDFQFSMVGKVEGDSFGNTLAHEAPVATMGDPSTDLAGEPGPTYRTHSNGYSVQGQHQARMGSYHSDHGHVADDAGDILATASALNQLRAGGDFLQTQEVPSAWGSFMAPSFPGLPAPESSASPVTSSRQSAGSSHGPNQQLLNQSLPQQQTPRHMTPGQMAHMQQQQLQGRLPDRPQALHIDARTLEQFNLGQMRPASPYMQYASRSQGYGYGNESDISALTYRTGRNAAGGERVYALPGRYPGEPMTRSVPTPSQAHRHMTQQGQRTFTGHVHNASSDSNNFQHTAPSPSANYAGLPSFNASPSVGTAHPVQQQQWANSQFRIPYGSGGENGPESEDSHTRKRRKSQMQHDDELEYAPERTNQYAVPKRGPKVPKAEVAIDDHYEPYTPSNNPSAKRRRTSSTVDRPDSMSPSDMPSPSNGETPTNAKRKARDSRSRHNLSEDQKRQNHIESEQKRRNVIKQGYLELNQLVPSLSGGRSGLSKAEILKEVIGHLERTIAGNATAISTLGQVPDDYGNASDSVEAY